MTPPRKIASMVALLTLLVSTTAWAQDDDAMTFSPDEAEEDSGGDDGEMTFAPDDLEEDSGNPEQDMAESVDVGVVAVPSEDLSDSQRDELQQALMEATERVPEINTYGDSDLLPALVDRGPEYCSREALCLASVGRNAGVQRIVQARVQSAQGGGYRLDLDYFDVDDRLFVAYHSNSEPSSFGDVIDAIPPGVDDLFGIRRDGGGDDGVVDPEVDVQRVMAYASGGGAVASLVGGILFGLQAGGLQEELQNAQNEDGEYVGITQTEARQKSRDMDSAALNANIFYGLSAALGITSTLLFVFGGDDAPEDGGADGQAGLGDDPTGHSSVMLIPQFGADQVGNA